MPLNIAHPREGCQVFTAREIADLSGKTRQGIQWLARRERWTRRIEPRNGGETYTYRLQDLPDALRAAILRKQAEAAAGPAPEPEAFPTERSERLWMDVAKLAAPAREIGAKRAAIVVRACDLQQAGSISFTSAAERAAEGEEGGSVSAESVRAWRERCQGWPRRDWPAVLATRHGGGGRAADIDPAAWQAFKDDYLRLEAPALAACHRRLVDLAKRHGWQVPKSGRTLLRRLEAECDRSEIVLARQGKEALERMTPAQTRLRPEFSMDALDCDGHKLDLFVDWHGDGRPVRVYLMAWQDLASSKILGWRIDEFENAESYRLAFLDVLRKHGIPGSVYCDNGRGIASKRLTGGAKNRYRWKIRPGDPVGLLTQLLGADNIHFTKPYSGRSKPIERFFRDLAEEVSKHPLAEGAWTGNSPASKPENYGSRSISREDLLLLATDCIAKCNAREGRRGMGLNGQSFDQAFEERYDTGRVARPAQFQLDRWKLAAEGVTAAKLDGSIRLFGTKYWARELEELVDRPADKRRVTVRFDPGNLHLPVAIERADGSLIAHAKPHGPVKFNSRAAAEGSAQLTARHARATKKALDAKRSKDKGDLKRLYEEALPAEERPAIAPEKSARRGQEKVVAGAFGVDSRSHEETIRDTGDRRSHEEMIRDGHERILRWAGLRGKS